MNSRKSLHSNNSKRRDGLKTRSLILEAAGHVFAERGYADTTSKEICSVAGTNVAAVNYYFGSRDNLYEEVLVEAHRRLISLENITAIAESDASPEDKLRQLMGHLIGTAKSSSSGWGVRVFLREILAPSHFAVDALIPAVLPKAAMAKKIVSENTGYPANSPEVQRALMFVVLPLFAMILFPEKLRSLVAPASTGDPDLLKEDLIKHTLAGLKALRKQ